MAMNAYGMYDVPPEIAAEQERIARQQAIADAMLKNSMTPLATNQGPIHWTQVLAQGVNARQGRVDSDAAAASRRSLGQQYQTGLADEVKRIAAVRQGQTIAPDPQEIEQANDQGYAEPRPVSTGNPKAAIEAALLSQYPQVRQMGALEHKTFENEQTKAADRDARSFDRLMALEAEARRTDATLAQRQEAAKSAEALRKEIAARDDQTRRENNARDNETRRLIGANRPAARAPVGFRFSSDGETLEPIPGGPKDKQAALPSAALKLQQGELDALATAKSISADLQAVGKMMDDGKLEVGPVENLWSQARNAVNQSSENSRNFNTFKTTLERLRNESLRLNKGVQTEGDAVRAWNELMGSLSDQKLVRDRLRDIGEINERAANFRRMNVDSIRSNYGLPAMDTAGYENQGPAVRPAASDEPPPGAVRRK